MDVCFARLLIAVSDVTSSLYFILFFASLALSKNPLPPNGYCILVEQRRDCPRYSEKVVKREYGRDKMKAREC